MRVVPHYWNSSKEGLQMLTRPSFATFGLLVVLTLVTTSCSDPVGPSPEVIAASGNYFAHPGGGAAPLDTRLGTFTVTENGVTTDMLEAGASIGVILDRNGVTDGRLLIPGEIDARLYGSWTLEDGVVRFSHEADTFVRDMEFRAENGRLVGEAVFDGVTIRVTLERTT